MVLGGPHVRVASRHRAETLVPVRHGVNDAVRLGRRGEMLRLARTRELEGVLEHLVDPPAGEDALLHDHLAFGAFVEPPSDLGVLALVVLAHDVEVDVLRSPARRGDTMPDSTRTGRRLTYWANLRRMGMRRPHSETWSGTPGKPTAPRKMASNSARRSRPSGGIIQPSLRYVSQLHGKCSHASSIPCRRAAASTTRIPSGTTSRPIPSPAMAAIRFRLMLMASLRVLHVTRSLEGPRSLRMCQVYKPVSGTKRTRLLPVARSVGLREVGWLRTCLVGPRRSLARGRFGGDANPSRTRDPDPRPTGDPWRGASLRLERRSVSSPPGRVCIAVSCSSGARQLPAARSANSREVGWLRTRLIGLRLRLAGFHRPGRCGGRRAVGRPKAE